MTRPPFQCDPQPDGSLKIHLPAGCLSKDKRALVQQTLFSLYHHLEKIEGALVFEALEDFFRNTPWIDHFFTETVYGQDTASDKIHVFNVTTRDVPGEDPIERKKLEQYADGMARVNILLNNLSKGYFHGKAVLNGFKLTDKVSLETLPNIRERIWQSRFKQTWSAYLSQGEAEDLGRTLDQAEVAARKGPRL